MSDNKANLTKPPPSPLSSTHQKLSQLTSKQQIAGKFLHRRRTAYAYAFLMEHSKNMRQRDQAERASTTKITPPTKISTQEPNSLVTILANSSCLVIERAIRIWAIIEDTILLPPRPSAALVGEVIMETGKGPMLCAFVLQEQRTLLRSKILQVTVRAQKQNRKAKARKVSLHRETMVSCQQQHHSYELVVKRLFCRHRSIGTSTALIHSQN